MTEQEKELMGRAVELLKETFSAFNSYAYEIAKKIVKVEEEYEELLKKTNTSSNTSSKPIKQSDPIGDIAKTMEF